MSADQSSFGPALVGNISVDSLDNDSATAAATAQQPEQGQITSQEQNPDLAPLDGPQHQQQQKAELEPESEEVSEPKLDFETESESAEQKHDEPQASEEPPHFEEQLLLETEVLKLERPDHQEPPQIESEALHQTQQEPPQTGNLLDLTFDAPSSPVAAPQVEAHHTGGDYSSFEHDAYVTLGPTIREAEEYADQMTSEILEQVVAYAALGCILTSGLIRIYKTSMKALNRSPETPLDHIWDRVLNVDVSMSPEQLHGLVDSSHAHLNASLVYLKQVLLVEDKIATTKIFLILYSLTYIGSWFNGLTLITIIYLALFSVPKLYESNKSRIDEYLSLATKQLSSAIDSVTNKFGVSSKKQN